MMSFLDKHKSYIHLSPGEVKFADLEGLGHRGTNFDFSVADVLVSSRVGVERLEVDQGSESPRICQCFPWITIYTPRCSLCSVLNVYSP